MERFLRDWRQDALNKAQYDSAIFIGDKLLAMTSTTARHPHPMGAPEPLR
jgi:anaphase-promoting complex subunit 6